MIPPLQDDQIIGRNIQESSRHKSLGLTMLGRTQVGNHLDVLRVAQNAHFTATGEGVHFRVCEVHLIYYAEDRVRSFDTERDESSVWYDQSNQNGSTCFSDEDTKKVQLTLDDENFVAGIGNDGSLISAHLNKDQSVVFKYRTRERCDSRPLAGDPIPQWKTRVTSRAKNNLWNCHHDASCITPRQY